MDDANRVPIDIGHEIAAAAETDQRTVVKEDGTVVIDILAPQPCAAQPTTEPEIVVCGVAPGNQASEDKAPPPPTSAIERLGEALHVKIGPVELGSIPKGDGTRAFGARVRF